MIVWRLRSVSGDHVTRFNGTHISAGELKKSIIKELKISDSVEIENASTRKMYENNAELIPKNTRILVKRVPNFNKVKTRRNEKRPQTVKQQKVGSMFMDLTKSKLTEQERIQEMMSQAAHCYYDPMKFNKFQTYICKKCNETGHWIHDCPFVKSEKGKQKIVRPKGIPLTMLVEVDPSENVPAMQLSNGTWVRTLVAFEEAQKKMKMKKLGLKKVVSNPVIPEIPKEIICALCKNIYDDPHQSVCCSASACFECFFQYFLEHNQCWNCFKFEFTGADIILNLKMKEVVNWYNLRGSLPYETTTSDNDIKLKIEANRQPEEVAKVKSEVKPPIKSEPPQNSSDTQGEKIPVICNKSLNFQNKFKYPNKRKRWHYPYQNQNRWKSSGYDRIPKQRNNYRNRNFSRFYFN